MTAIAQIFRIDSCAFCRTASRGHLDAADAGAREIEAGIFLEGVELGAALERSGDKASAEATFLAILDKHPDVHRDLSAAVLEDYARVLTRQGKTARARVVMDKARLLRVKTP